MNLRLDNDPSIICAISTPPGKAALSIVRVSGAGCVTLVANMIPILSSVKPDDARRIYHDFALDSHGAPIDEITVIPYFAPHSYTAEEMVEIICHGGFAASRAIIKRLLECGAHLAEPGEFTKRAFLNGRISLSEAEAVASAIEAKSELALKAAARNLKGELFQRISTIRDRIADLLTLLEAEIDFSDDEIDKTSPEKIKTTLASILSDTSRIAATYNYGRGLNVGYKIAIVGRANVGKSSLLNALLQKDRAIVTDIPGTTRDIISEWIELDGFPIQLIDTAGLRESIDIVERLGQDRTKSEIENADLILFMLDGHEGITDDDLAIKNNLPDKSMLIVINKSDLKFNVETQHLASPKLRDKIHSLIISALTGHGLDNLKNEISAMLNIAGFDLSSALIANERQYQCITEAAESLTQAIDEIASNQSHEVLAVFLRDSLNHLGELVGETTRDDILNNIFSRFCIGK